MTSGGADFQALLVEADLDSHTKALAAAFVRRWLAGDDDEVVADVLAMLGLDGS